MIIDRDQFMDRGYLILRKVISPKKLESMRASSETILERQKVVWANERRPGDPPGGLFETDRQPRVVLEQPGLIDPKTANIVEDFWAADDTLDIASQLLCNPEPHVEKMMMMCNPVRDWPGGTGWHRDVYPADMAPMDALASDFTENGPKYVQWNVPLYDDSVLWVVPGSHRRRNTAQETADLLDDIKKPIVGGTPVELNAGDGVIYSNFLLHTGSNYTTKKRRTIHGGHTVFAYYDELGFTGNLSPWALQRFEDSSRQSERLKDNTENILRAVIGKDATAYRAELESIQPGVGPNGKTALTIYLSKAARNIRILKDPDLYVSVSRRKRAMSPSPTNLNWGSEFADRFTPEESEILWDRFETLDTALQDDMEMYEPGFRTGPMYYYFNELPDGVDTESFIESWESRG
jgi:hypothetical protein